MEALAVTILEKLSSAAYKDLKIIWNLKEEEEARVSFLFF